MRRFVLMAALAAVALPAAAQQNPFKVKKADAKAQVSYTMSGDMSGTSSVAFDGERMARRATSTTKMMGKTSSSDTWTLTTPDSTYNADLTKKKGTVGPNLLPHVAKAYDDLDGDSKKRLHQNMEDMAAVMSKAFGSLGLSGGGEKLGTKTYAGQECEERKMGGFEICTMSKAPIMLHTKASIVCLNYEETATDVKLGSVSADAFAAPAGVVFTPDQHIQNADSTALGYVNYLASQQLADSLAKAKTQMEAAQAQAGPSGQIPKMTPEQQASMQKACDAMKNLDVGKMISDASNQMLKSMADQAKQAAVNTAKNAAENKVKGIFKKPKIPTL
jgi:hypothetical protein